jgi:hypothetical protein
MCKLKHDHRDYLNFHSLHSAPVRCDTEYLTRTFSSARRGTLRGNAVLSPAMSGLL